MLVLARQNISAIRGTQRRTAAPLTSFAIGIWMTDPAASKSRMSVAI